MTTLRGSVRVVTMRGVRSASSAATGQAKLRKTPLYDLHVARGAKMVPFGGFAMPVQYAGMTVSESHHFTRTQASLFDVSHMVQHTFRGPGAAELLERVTPCGIRGPGGLGMLQSRLSALLWPKTGGIVDDTIITRTGDDTFHVVTNAACRNKDLGFIAGQMDEMGVGKEVWTVEDNSGLIALQGPSSAAILQEVLASDDVDLRSLHFGNAVYAQVKLLSGSATRDLLVTRGGYTGEDGFEISLIVPAAAGHDAGTTTTTFGAADEVVPLAEALLEKAGPDRLRLAGLGARDSLRLEAGMCLYGHDLDDGTTPPEAGLGWIVSPERRRQGGFNGADAILPQMTPRTKGGKGVARRRVGFIVEGAPAREGAEIISKEGDQSIGRVTSGAPSPTLGKYIAMGYVRDGFHKSGTDVDIKVRGKKRPAVVTKMPFVPAKYWKGEGATLG